MKSYTLEITVFVSGAVVMMLELTGSRILAPFVGTSTFIWTSLIGVILGSLSLGYYHGGARADQDPSTKRLGQILFISGLAIGVVAVINQTVLGIVTQYFSSLRWSAAVSACILFGPPAYLLGMVSPQAVRIRMNDITTAGTTIGRLYALSSLGSIFGTFLVGFYLMAWVGSRNILFILSVLTLLLSLLNFRNKETWGALAIFILAPFVQSFGKGSGLKVLDTEYSAIQIQKIKYHDGKWVQIMKIGNEYSSGMYPDSDSLAFDYYHFYKLMLHYHPNPKEVLLIGGGALSVPKYFQKVYPGIHIDALEIDPALTEIAKSDFRYVPSSSVRNIHEDGRIFLNHNKKQYDVILGDAYRSLFSIPFHLVSKEAIGLMAGSLTNEGVLLINILSPVTGPKKDLIQSMIKTCQSVFPQVKAFKTTPNKPDERVQNIMLVCFKKASGSFPTQVSPEIAGMLRQEVPLEKFDSDQGIVLTDDFAPVEHYAEKMLSNYFRK